MPKLLFTLGFYCFFSFLIYNSQFITVFAADHTYYLHTDALGSVTAVTDDTGAVVRRNNYSPYGSARSISTTIGNKVERGYTGQITDPRTTLAYYNARYYDPILSRFLSPDSVAGGNLYAYVGGNPISRTDPSGNFRVDDQESNRDNRSYSPTINTGSKNKVVNTLTELDEIAIEKAYAHPNIANLIDSGISVNSPFYSGTGINTNDPRYALKYKDYVDELKLVQETATSFEDLIRKEVAYIFNRDPYNPSMIAAVHKEKRLINKLRIINKSILLMGSYTDADPRFIRATARYDTTANLLNKAFTEEKNVWGKLHDTPEVIEEIQSNQPICGVYALMGQYGFKQLGVQTYAQTVEFNHYEFYHANLYGFFGGKKWVIDPTWNLVMPFENYKKYMSSLSWYYGGQKTSPDDIHFKSLPTELDK